MSPVLGLPTHTPRPIIMFNHRPAPHLTTRLTKLNHHFIAAWPNPSIQGTPEKLRFSVPSLRSVAPDLER
jgi:hypothetical protein